MHDSSTATLNKVNYHQVEEKSGHIGVLSLNNHQVDYLQLDNYQLDYHRRDYHKVDYHQQRKKLSGRHLWLDCRKMICDKLLQQVLDLLSGIGIPAHFYLLWFVNLWLASSSSSLLVEEDLSSFHLQDIESRNTKPCIRVDWRPFMKTNLNKEFYFEVQRIACLEIYFYQL